MTKKELLDRFAHSGRSGCCWPGADKLELAQNRGAPAHTPFLSPGEQAVLSTSWPPGTVPGTCSGGDIPTPSGECAPSSPTGRRRTTSGRPGGPPGRPGGPLSPGGRAGPPGYSGLSYGLGITREKLGDILLPEPGVCQVVALRESLPILLSQWEGAGRWKIRLEAIPLDHLTPRPAQVKTIRDTVATPGWTQCWLPASLCPAPRRRGTSPPARWPSITGSASKGQAGGGGGRAHLPGAG